MKRTQTVLGHSKLCLHEFVSKNQEFVMVFEKWTQQWFATFEIIKTLFTNPTKSRTKLGIKAKDIRGGKRYTRKGVFSTSNSVFDSLGFLTHLSFRTSYLWEAFYRELLTGITFYHIQYLQSENWSISLSQSHEAIASTKNMLNSDVERSHFK